MKRSSSVLLVSLFAIFSLSLPSRLQAQIGVPRKYGHGMVVCATSQAGHIGTEIMQEGGNAIDAAVAVGFALAVTYPEAGNIGGGGFMVIRLADGTSNTLDFREKAPHLAQRTMYQDNRGNVIKNLSREGILSIGVPGTVDGMVTALNKYGKLPLKTVMAPAICLARLGYKLTQSQAEALNNARGSFLQYKSSTRYFTKPDSTLYHEGDLFRQPDLANTLQAIADSGRAGFYGGKVADQIVDEVQLLSGLIDHSDLENYHSVWRKPIITNYKDYKLIMVPPPSSGGIAIAQILKMVEPYNIGQYGFNSIYGIHLLAEAERRTFADRAYFLGDPQFVKIPVDSLISSGYLKKRMSTFEWDHATPSSKVRHGTLPVGFESNETTHYSIVDPEGNAVAVTYTLNGGFGSHVAVDRAGFLLNNEMDDFVSKPGVPNMYGLLGGEANSIQPGKRMLSSMSPTIVTQKGKLRMVLGSPGGSTIITTVVQVFLNVSEFGMNIQQAVSAPRFHHQWYPDEIFYEPYTFNNEIVAGLKKLGYHLHQRSGYTGRANCIFVEKNGMLDGGADPRGDDFVSGF